MASFGHVAVGLLAARLHGGATAGTAGGRPRCSWWTLAAFAALAELPDADVVMVALGAHDRGAVGHRGASHSLLVAITAGALCGLLARRLGWPALRTAVAAALAVASHGVLDAFGEGGRGILLLWPLSGARFMSPLRLLPDAPRGLGFLSLRGLFDVALEFVLFFPLTAFALWPRPEAAAHRVVVAGPTAAPARAAEVTAAPRQQRQPPDRCEPPARSTG
jgi:inner membrane protein